MRNDLYKKYLVVGIVFFMVFSSISTTNLVDADSTDNVEIADDETGFFASSYNLSEYWGNKDMKLTEGTGFFDTYKDENGTWWFVDPEGYAFYSVGRWGAPPSNETVLDKFGGEEGWANVTRERVKMWGLNTFGCYIPEIKAGGHSFDRELQLFDDGPIPYLYKFGFATSRANSLIQHMGRFWDKIIPDVFDPYFWEMVEKNISEVVERNISEVRGKLKDDPYLLGYFLGNEMDWESSPVKGFDENTLLEHFMSLQCSIPGKMKAVEFLTSRYEGDGVEVFNRVWNMNLNSFDELYGKQELGREGWRIQSDLPTAKLKLIKDDPELLFNLKILDRAESDIRDFARLVAKWFFKNVTEILHRYDPNHLTLGVRIHWRSTPREVLEEMGKYCDVISINYYRSGNLLFYELDNYLAIRRKGLVPLNNWMKKYYDITGKPLMVAEWSTERNFSLGPLNLINIRLPERIYTKNPAIYTKKCMERPYIIGIEGGYGLMVDKVQEPYKLIVNRLKEVHSQMYEIHSKAR